MKKKNFKSTTTEMINFRKKLEGFEGLLRKNLEKTEKLDFLEVQLNKLTKEFNNMANSTQIMKNHDLFTKEITILKEKTNNLAIQVFLFENIHFINVKFFFIKD